MGEFQVSLGISQIGSMGPRDIDLHLLGRSRVSGYSHQSEVALTKEETNSWAMSIDAQWAHLLNVKRNPASHPSRPSAPAHPKDTESFSIRRHKHVGG